MRTFTNWPVSSEFHKEVRNSVQVRPPGSNQASGLAGAGFVIRPSVRPQSQPKRRRLMLRVNAAPFVSAVNGVDYRLAGVAI